MNDSNYLPLFCYFCSLLQKMTIFILVFFVLIFCYDICYHYFARNVFVITNNTLIFSFASWRFVSFYNLHKFLHNFYVTLNLLVRLFSVILEEDALKWIVDTTLLIGITNSMKKFVGYFNFRWSNLRNKQYQISVVFCRKYVFSNYKRI